MKYIISELIKYDNKRVKVTLNFSEVIFLLYMGEAKKYIPEGRTELSEEEFNEIEAKVLVPRAKKKVLYYLKNADKTRYQIRKKLKEGYYPESVIEKVFEFLNENDLVDDLHYARSLTKELKLDHSRNEIKLRLLNRGIGRETINEALAFLTDEDELNACKRVMEKRFPQELSRHMEASKRYTDRDSKDIKTIYRFLFSKGFSNETIHRTLEESY